MINLALIQAAQPSGGLGLGLAVQLIAFVAILYFIIIMPHRREQKRHREMVAGLKAGDEVITTGGLVGEIVQIKDDRLTLKTGDARVSVERGRIASKIEE